jgi:hypothetical protein
MWIQEKNLLKKIFFKKARGKGQPVGPSAVVSDFVLIPLATERKIKQVKNEFASKTC